MTVYTMSCFIIHLVMLYIPNYGSKFNRDINQKTGVLTFQYFSNFVDLRVKDIKVFNTYIIKRTYLYLPPRSN
jgi:hypothetical protein